MIKTIFKHFLYEYCIKLIFQHIQYNFNTNKHNNLQVGKKYSSIKFQWINRMITLYNVTVIDIHTLFNNAAFVTVDTNVPAYIDENIIPFDENYKPSQRELKGIEDTFNSTFAPCEECYLKNMYHIKTINQRKLPLSFNIHDIKEIKH